MTTRNQQSWGVGALAAVAIVLAFTVVILTGAASTPSGSFNKSSPEGGYRSDQSWFLFDGDGATCHVESWSDNPNRSLHDNILVTVDTNGTTTHLAVERFQGTTDRGLWDSTETGEVYLQLHLGEDQRSSASYHAEWTCEEAPPSTTNPPSSSSSTSTSTSMPDPTTTSTSSTTEPPTTSTPSTTVPPTTTTVPPSTPIGIPTGEG